MERRASSEGGLPAWYRVVRTVAAVVVFAAVAVLAVRTAADVAAVWADLHQLAAQGGFLGIGGQG